MNVSEKNIPFARPFTGREEEEAVLRVLRSGWLTTGQEALAFEKEFAAFLGAGTADSRRPRGGPASAIPGSAAPLHCLAVNSATSGLHLALEALGIGPGDAVFLPSYTFTATAEVVRYLGAEAVFVDIAPDTYHMDPSALEAAVHRMVSAAKGNHASGGVNHAGAGNSGLKPRAVIPVHFGGIPCDMEAICGIARRCGLSVVEDAAHAFPAAGVSGDAGVFSFYATKTITTGEGGMIATGRKDLADRIAVMRSHGIDRAAWDRYTNVKASWYYEVVAPGYKYNMPDILAALGRVQLSRAMELLAMRISIAERYDNAFGNEEALVIQPPGGARHLYTIRLRESGQRDGFIQKLSDMGIGTSVHFIPLHIMPYYRDRYSLKPEDFPESLKRFRESVSLPIWPGMSAGQVERVIDSVRKALR